AGDFEPPGPEQKFFLSPESLTLVFDHETPHLQPQNPFHSSVLRLNIAEIEGAAAVYTRFAGDERADALLYGAEHPPAKLLLYNVSEPYPAQESIVTETVGGALLYMEAQHLGRLPPQIQAAVLEELRPGPELYAAFERAAAGGDNGYDGYDYRAFADCQAVGAYYCTRISSTARVPGSGLDTEPHRNRCKTWRAAGLSEMRIGDFFKEGFDYEALLREKLRDELNADDWYVEGKLPEQFSESDLDAICAGLLQNGVELSSETLGFTTDVLEMQYVSEEMVEKLQFAGIGNRFRQAVFVYVSFDEIGYENLTLFD
ncbi:MAG: hypothetical protein LBB57_04020, partial [Clostridiales Family XIII bacterium]|nr:hypothetical protein [Clostridiales Family XIII bacterium]